MDRPNDKRALVTQSEESEESRASQVETKQGGSVPSTWDPVACLTEMWDWYTDPSAQRKPGGFLQSCFDKISGKSKRRADRQNDSKKVAEHVQEGAVSALDIAKREGKLVDIEQLLKLWDDKKSMEKNVDVKTKMDDVSFFVRNLLEKVDDRERASEPPGSAEVKPEVPDAAAFVELSTSFEEDSTSWSARESESEKQLPRNASETQGARNPVVPSEDATRTVQTDAPISSMSPVEETQVPTSSRSQEQVSCASPVAETLAENISGSCRQAPACSRSLKGWALREDSPTGEKVEERNAPGTPRKFDRIKLTGSQVSDQTDFPKNIEDVLSDFTVDKTYEIAPTALFSRSMKLLETPTKGGSTTGSNDMDLDSSFEVGSSNVGLSPAQFLQSTPAARLSLAEEKRSLDLLYPPRTQKANWTGEVSLSHAGTSKLHFESVQANMVNCAKLHFFRGEKCQKQHCFFNFECEFLHSNRIYASSGFTCLGKTPFASELLRQTNMYSENEGLLNKICLLCEILRFRQICLQRHPESFKQKINKKSNKIPQKNC